jgi:hypothetical protein
VGNMSRRKVKEATLAYKRTSRLKFLQNGSQEVGIIQSSSHLDETKQTNKHSRCGSGAGLLGRNDQTHSRMKQ